MLLVSSYNEVRALRVDSAGNIYVAAVSGRPPGSASDRTSTSSAPEPAAPTSLTPNVTTEITVVAVADSAPQPIQSSGSSSARSGPTAGAIFRILPDGAWDQIWESRDDVPYDVAFEPGGSLLVATGNKGKLYRLAGDPLQPTLIARANAQQITSIVTEKEGRVL